MGKYAKQKGAAGEREFAALLREFGFEGQRQGRQFFRSDGREHEDVEHNVKGIHFEVKRTKEKLDVPAAFRQARLEKPDRIPAVAWRANRQPWRIIQDAEDWLARERLIEDLREALKNGNA